MYLLDTNVVSELRRLHPHPAVVGWIEQVAADELFLSAVTVVTRNVRDFDQLGVDLLNPFEHAPDVRR